MYQQNLFVTIALVVACAVMAYMSLLVWLLFFGFVLVAYVIYSCLSVVIVLIAGFWDEED